ncbi:MAG: rhomboid family intramembrane serine protease [candidate division WOR-3 bacterium]
MIPLKDDVPKVRVRFPIFMLLLLISNIIVFIYEMSLSQSGLNRLISNYGAIPLFITRGENLYTLFSAMFLHGGFDHIIGNMLYLWIFADNVEDALGHFWFIIMYFLAGLAGSFLHILMARDSAVPMIGASGAISGVLGSYLIFFPTARILALVPFGFFLRIVYLPAYLFLGFWILLQFIYGFASLPGVKGGGIAFFAHIGGFLIGVLWGLLFRQRVKKVERGF